MVAQLRKRPIFEKHSIREREPERQREIERLAHVERNDERRVASTTLNVARGLACTGEQKKSRAIRP